MCFVYQIMIMGEAVSQRERESVRESREPEDLKEGEMETRPRAHTHVRETERRYRKEDSEDRDSPNWIHASSHSLIQRYPPTHFTAVRINLAQTSSSPISPFFGRYRTKCKLPNLA